MVWGSIAYGFKSPLVVINGTMNAVKYILAPHVVPIAQQGALMTTHDPMLLGSAQTFWLRTIFTSWTGLLIARIFP